MTLESDEREPLIKTRNHVDSEDNFSRVSILIHYKILIM